MRDSQLCSLCGLPPMGSAAIDGTPFCHSDLEVGTCYDQALWMRRHRQPSLITRIRHLLQDVGLSLLTKGLGLR